MGSTEALLLQMTPHFLAHLKIVWHLMLIMSLLVLIISSVQYFMNILLDVLNEPNEFVRLVRFKLDMS